MFLRVDHMEKYWVITFLIISPLLFAGNLPDNSHPNIFGTDWDCDHGYYRSGQKCVKVIVPENASIDIYGTEWACNRGYYKSGQKCVKVIVPENARIDIYGSDWSCNRGFYKSGQKCVKVVVPENAGIDVYGSGWVCNRGYYKSGQKCVKVIVPENAGIDVYGSGWVCNKGYKKSNNKCIPVTKAELQKQKELEQAVIEKMRKRRLQGVSGDDCKTEYKTNAEVCVDITGGDLDCNKSFSGDYYRDCDVVLNYDVKTNYSGGSYLDVEVECNVEIQYKGRETYSTQSDSSSKDESHNLYAHGNESETMRFNFSFSSYKEITSVKISSAKCEIESVNLW